MEKPAEVHVVTYEGPEWSTIKGIFYDHVKASAFAAEQNEARNMADVYDSLSEYVVRSYPVVS